MATPTVSVVSILTMTMQDIVQLATDRDSAPGSIGYVVTVTLAIGMSSTPVVTCGIYVTTATRKEPTVECLVDRMEELDCHKANINKHVIV